MNSTGTKHFCDRRLKGQAHSDTRGNKKALASRQACVVLRFATLMRRHWDVQAVPLIFALLTVVSPAHAQTGEQVLLVVNDASATSSQIADYYARTRAISSENTIHLIAPTTEQISRADFERSIETPIAAWFTRTLAHDRILYIVLTKGVPLRIAGTGGLDGTVASVDSELTLLYRKLTGTRVPVLGRVDNPYFARDTAVATFKPFSHQAYDVFLVTRLDGFTVQDVLALIDRGGAPVRDGKFVLDQKATLVDRGGDAWLQNAATRLSSIGFQDRVALDTSTRVVTGERNVLGYYSWGSNDPAVKARHFDLTFVPGALAGTYVSSDGRTFTEPPADWKIGSWSDPRSHFAGSPQSLAGDLIRDGVTGIAAHVAEPYLDATVRPDVLFPAYVSGFNLAESFYLATRYLSWQTMVIGDPLCAPFKREPLAAEHINPGVDPTTELPRYFAARRLQAFTRPGWKPDAAGLVLRAETRIGHGDPGGARQALEQAVALDGRIDVARRMLALLYDGGAEYEKAIEQYRAALALTPNDLVVLNNLAYALAVHRKQPQEALPLAQRASRLAGDSPVVTDTLAWVHHLLGNDAEAARLLTDAIKRDGAGGPVHLHAAVVFDALGRQADASRELDRALERSPDLAKDDEVTRLRAQLKQSR